MNLFLGKSIVFDQNDAMISLKKTYLVVMHKTQY